MTINDVIKIIDPVRRRIMNIISRGINRGVDDTKGIQRMKSSLFSDEIHDRMERFQEYGFTSVPKVGAEAIAIFHSGNREHGIIIAVDDRRFRLKNLQEGEVAIYTDEGDKIHFKRDKKIDIETSELTINATAKVIVNTQEATVTANTTTVTSPEVTVISTTKVTMTTPLLEVSGLVTCAGLASGGAAPAAGKVVVQGKIETTGDIESAGNVKDTAGTMAAIRTTYNAHQHGSSVTPTPTM